MNDKELLIMAAKAVGEVGEYVEDYCADQFYHGNDWGILIGSVGCRHVWNPLICDGEALRLAVMLEMTVNIQGKWVMVDCGDITKRDYDDATTFSATRRAIVRAAAEIGSKL